MSASWWGRHRRSTRNVTIVAAALGAVLVVGIGTAGASDRGRWGAWGKKHRPRPPASATQPGMTPTPTPSRTPSPTGTAAPSPTRVTTAPPATGPARLPANAGFDYQIGEAYAPPAGVGVVSRDKSAAPAAGAYNICYLNGFQAQPDEVGGWKRDHDDLLLKSGGSYVVDGDWNEVLFDISTAAKREALAAIVGRWMAGCATKGYQAVEIDNLDSWTRSRGALNQAAAVAYAKLLAAAAHAKGLAIAQKNTVEIAGVGKREIGFDFAIAESCADYEMSAGVPECQGFVDVYGSNVLVIEYDSSHFQRACTRYGDALSIVLRDRDVTAPGSGSYVFKPC